MASSKTKKFVVRQLSAIEATVFFAVYYLSVLLIIEPQLIYFMSGRVIHYYPFVMDREFLYESLTMAGGPTYYLTGFLTQCFYVSWIGALILTGLGWLSWWLSKKMFTVTKTECVIEVCYLFPVLLLAMYVAYNHQLLIAVSLSLVLAAFIVYLRADLPKGIFAAALFLAEFTCLYYIVGGTVVLFGLLAAIYELLVKRRIVLAGGFFVSLGVYYLGVRFWCFSDIPPFRFMYVLPFLIVLQIARSKYSVKNKKKSVQMKSHSGKDDLAKRSPFRWYAWLILRKAIPVALIFLTFCVFYKEKAKTAFQIEYYADKEDWPNVLQCAGRYPGSRYNDFCHYDINRALYYTGRLGDDMFSYRQVPEALLLSNTSSGSAENSSHLLHWNARKTDLFMELGCLGEAKICAFEALDLANGCPYLVKKLALIYLAEDQNETAKIYLGALSKDLIYGRFARELLLRLEKEPVLTDYEPVQYLRSVAIKTDHIGEYDLDNFFLRLLQRNPHNKMAFEYMMAVYLLTGQVEKVAQNISRLNDFGYEKMPRHYEEAMLFYTVRKQKQLGGKINIRDLPASSETIGRFERYNQQFESLYRGKYDRKTMRQLMAKDFGDTYMFYLNYDLQRAGE